MESVTHLLEFVESSLSCQALECVPIIAILTLDFSNNASHVKRHEEPVKGRRGLTALYRLMHKSLAIFDALIPARGQHQFSVTRCDLHKVAKSLIQDFSSVILGAFFY